MEYDESTGEWKSFDHWDRERALRAHVAMQEVLQDIHKKRQGFRLIASIPVQEARDWMHKRQGGDIGCSDYNDELYKFLECNPEWKINPRETLSKSLFADPVGEAEAIDGVHNCRPIDKDFVRPNSGQGSISDEVVGNVAEKMKELLSKTRRLNPGEGISATTTVDS